MQPYTAAFAKAKLTPQEGDVAIGKRKYRAEIGDGAGCVRETGPDGERKYPIAHVMGGKNVYYFLTPLERGRLQVLPVAYDVHKKAWYDMAASGVRHFPDRRDEALDWTDRMFAFNTTCFNCHVSRTGDELRPGHRHLPHDLVRAGHQLRIVPRPGRRARPRRWRPASKATRRRTSRSSAPRSSRPQQMNDMCATCHAKLVPLSLSFLPGDKFFDHFDLITLEHPDFYPDGRDLGENYTYTSWLMSPCAKSGKLDCNHCHTPSGRMRFEGEKSNQMCMPCHEKEVEAAGGARPSRGRAARGTSASPATCR